MARERVVDVYVPVVAVSGGGLGGVGAIFAVVVAAVAVAVLAMFVVALAFPSHRHTPDPATRQPGTCAPFCPVSSSAGAPPAQFPFGGEQR
ncbi:hypothetical protein [Nocardia wallacei]|uniref:hypothetical protein n=1 Tax=Nocardia wallacei TaxID=480035 RepID=UPI002458D581|nr:hypothetical protein [Nocardia wallacei]